MFTQQHEICPDPESPEASLLRLRIRRHMSWSLQLPLLQDWEEAGGFLVGVSSWGTEAMRSECVSSVLSDQAKLTSRSSSVVREGF